MKGGIETTFAGALDTFQIWKRDTYDAEQTRQAAADMAVMSGHTDMLSLLPAAPGV